MDNHEVSELDIATHLEEEIQKGLAVEERLAAQYLEDQRLEAVAKETLAGPKAVDLVMYIGGERKIVGKATVIEGVVFSKLNDGESAGDQATRAIMNGMVDAISVGFIMRPLYPETKVDNVKDALMKQHNYNFEPTRPFPGKEKVGYITPDPEEAQLVRGTKEPWQDKFPYGPK